MTFDDILLYSLFAILGILITGVATVFVLTHLFKKMGKAGTFIFLIVAGLMVHGSFPPAKEKNKNEKVQFWSASTDTVYLIDCGSYVSNNLVHIEFETRLLPDSAMIYLDYIPKDAEPNAENYSTFKAMTAAEWPRKVDFNYEGATSNKWVMYTPHTPGPVVHTNGVAVAEFIKAQKYDNVAVPKRSTIWEDGKMLWPLPEDIARSKEVEHESD